MGQELRLGTTDDPFSSPVRSEWSLNRRISTLLDGVSLETGLCKLGVPCEGFLAKPRQGVCTKVLRIRVRKGELMKFNEGLLLSRHSMFI